MNFILSDQLRGVQGCENYANMINRNNSVRNSENNFKLPPIEGAIPTADVIRKPPARRNQATRRPQQSERRNAPQASRQTFVVPNHLKPINQQRRYKNTTSRAASYATVNSDVIPRKPLIERDFPNPRLVPAKPHPPNFLRSYAVLPPIKSEIETSNEKAPGNPHTVKARSESLLAAPRSSEKRKNIEAKTKQSSETSRKGQKTMSGERKSSATLLLFCQGTRKDRRVGVCPENEPTLINITDQLKEIFLRRNMEEMYLI